jgi:hypothetical protein
VRKKGEVKVETGHKGERVMLESESIHNVKSLNSSIANDMLLNISSDFQESQSSALRRS